MYRTVASIVKSGSGMGNLLQSVQIADRPSHVWPSIMLKLLHMTVGLVLKPAGAGSSAS